MMLFLYLTIVNMVCFGAFAMDKAAARGGRRRIPERSLLTLAVLGGTAGALAASAMLRHKTRKQPFRARLLIIAACQVTAAIVAIAAFIQAHSS